MRCRPSEVLAEDEAHIELWKLTDKVVAQVRERERKRQERMATRHGKRQ